MSRLRDATSLIEAAGRREATRLIDAAPIAAELYAEATQELLRRGHGVRGLRAAFDLGPVRYPGLSDLDVLFVLPDDFADFAALRPLLRAALPEHFHAPLTHNPFFVREAEYRAIFAFAPILQLRPLWLAAGFAPNTQGTNDDPLALALYLADIISESYPREFLGFLLEDSLHERDVIARLKGLAYCFELHARLGGAWRPRWRTFADDLHALREDYFALDPNVRWVTVLRLRQLAPVLALELAEDVAQRFEALWGFRVGGRLALWASRAAALYENTPGEAANTEGARAPHYACVRQRQTDVATRAPALFGWLVREYARGEGVVSTRLRARLDDRLTLHGTPAADVAEAVARRIALRNAHTAWVDAARLGLPTFLTFGYRSADADAPGASRLRRWLGERLERRREQALRATLLE